MLVQQARKPFSTTFCAPVAFHNPTVIAGQSPIMQGIVPTAFALTGGKVGQWTSNQPDGLVSSVKQVISGKFPAEIIVSLNSQVMQRSRDIGEDDGYADLVQMGDNQVNIVANVGDTPDDTIDMIREHHFEDVAEIKIFGVLNQFEDDTVIVGARLALSANQRSRRSIEF